MSEVDFPRIERLQAIDHRSIVTIGGLHTTVRTVQRASLSVKKYRCQDDKHEADVCLPHARVRVPGHPRELPACELEGRLV